MNITFPILCICFLYHISYGDIQLAIRWNNMKDKVRAGCEQSKNVARKCDVIKLIKKKENFKTSK